MVPSLVDLPDNLAAFAADADICFSNQPRALSTSLLDADNASRANDMGTGLARRKAAMFATVGLTASARIEDVWIDREKAREVSGLRDGVSRGIVGGLFSGVLLLYPAFA